MMFGFSHVFILIGASSFVPALYVDDLHMPRQSFTKPMSSQRGEWHLRHVVRGTRHIARKRLTARPRKNEQLYGTGGGNDPFVGPGSWETFERYRSGKLNGPSRVLENGKSSVSSPTWGDGRSIISDVFWQQQFRDEVDKDRDIAKSGLSRLHFPKETVGILPWNLLTEYGQEERKRREIRITSACQQFSSEEAGNLTGNANSTASSGNETLTLLPGFQMVGFDPTALSGFPGKGESDADSSSLTHADHTSPTETVNERHSALETEAGSLGNDRTSGSDDGIATPVPEILSLPADVTTEETITFGPFLRMPGLGFPVEPATSVPEGLSLPADVTTEKTIMFGPFLQMPGLFPVEPATSVPEGLSLPADVTSEETTATTVGPFIPMPAIGFPVEPLGPPVADNPETSPGSGDVKEEDCGEIHVVIDRDDVNDVCLVNEQDKAWSCRDKCGQAISLPCSCDVNCALHQTCCRDFVEMCPEVAASGGNLFAGVVATCDTSLGAMMISECPLTATAEEHSLCRTKDPLSLLDKVPVSDSGSHVQFRNVHCWRCWKTNNEPLQWSLNLTLDSRSRFKDDYSLHSILDFMVSHPQRQIWFPPHPLVKAECVRNMISHCTGCTADLPTISRCHDGLHSYVNINRQIYKNIYCFLCSKDHREGQKQICLPVNTLASPSHHMAFPVTMVFPKDQTDQQIAIQQNELVAGAYTWNTMSCSLSEYSCQAEECSDVAINFKGRCDSGLPFHYIIKMCKTNVETMTCFNGQTFRDMFGTDVEKLKHKLREMITNILSGYLALYQIRILHVGIADREDTGLQFDMVAGGLPTFQDIAISLVPQIRFRTHDDLSVGRSSGPLFVDIQASLSRKIEPVSISDMGLPTYLCGNAEILLTERSHSSFLNISTVCLLGGIFISCLGLGLSL